MQKFFKTRFWAVLLLLMSTLFITSCGDDDEDEPSAPAPTASFTFAPNAPQAGDVVTFTNTSENATSFSWAFGDGGTSDAANPTYTFEAAGTYTVTLTATGEGGETTSSQDITVAEAAPENVPTASFDFSPNPATAGEAVNFTFTGENAVSYAWDFQNDGTIDSEMENPSFTYDEAGAYSVKLTVTGADGTTAEAQRTVSVEANVVEYSVRILGVRFDVVPNIGSEAFPEIVDPVLAQFDLPLDQLSSFDQALWAARFNATIGPDDIPDGAIFGMDSPDPADRPVVEIPFQDLSKSYYIYFDTNPDNADAPLMFGEFVLNDFLTDRPADIALTTDNGFEYTLFVEWIEQ